MTFEQWVSPPDRARIRRSHAAALMSIRIPFLRITRRASSAEAADGTFGSMARRGNSPRCNGDDQNDRIAKHETQMAFLATFAQESSHCNRVIAAALTALAAVPAVAAQAAGAPAAVPPQAPRSSVALALDPAGTGSAFYRGVDKAVCMTHRARRVEHPHGGLRGRDRPRRVAMPGSGWTRIGGLTYSAPAAGYIPQSNGGFVLIAVPTTRCGRTESEAGAPPAGGRSAASSLTIPLLPGRVNRRGHIIAAVIGTYHVVWTAMYPTSNGSWSGFTRAWVPKG